MYPNIIMEIAMKNIFITFFAKKDKNVKIESAK
jgi:hypothetical protein